MATKSQVDTMRAVGNLAGAESSKVSKSQADTIGGVFSIISILVLEGSQISG